MLPAFFPVSRKIAFPAAVRWRLFMIHNRYSTKDLERLLVWSDGRKFEFTANDERDRVFSEDRRWACLGRLRWVVGRDGYYEHHIVPV